MVSLVPMGGKTKKWIQRNIMASLWDSLNKVKEQKLNLGQIKTGSMSRTDRVCKYNQLMRIEEELRFFVK